RDQPGRPDDARHQPVRRDGLRPRRRRGPRGPLAAPARAPHRRRARGARGGRPRRGPGPGGAPMTVVLAYAPGEPGTAATRAAARAAVLLGAGVVVVNTTRGDRLVDPRWADHDQLVEVGTILEEAGVEHEVRHLQSSALPAEVVLGVAAEVDADLVVV